MNPPRRDLPQVYEVDDPIIDWDTEKSTRLWTAVIVQAMKDIMSIGDSFTNGSDRKDLNREYAANWMRSESEEPTSFKWCCVTTGINADKLRSFVLGRKWNVRIKDPTGQRWCEMVQRESCKARSFTGSRTRGKHLRLFA